MAPPPFQLSGGDAPAGNGKPPVQAKMEIFRDNKNQKEYISLPKKKKNPNNNKVNNNNDIEMDNKKDPFQDVSDQTTLKVKEFSSLLDGFVDKAHNYVLANPKLGKFANLDGHTAKWVQKISPVNGPNDLSTYFGYAIESITTVLLPNEFKGWKVNTQAARQGTRPDIVLMDQFNNDMAWLDITASNSRGHINGKAGGWSDPKKSPFAVEVSYPSQNNYDFSQIRKQAQVKKDNNNDDNNNNDLSDPLGDLGDVNEILEKLENAKKLFKLQSQHWGNWGKPFLKSLKQRMGFKTFKEISEKFNAANDWNIFWKVRLPLTHAILRSFNGPVLPDIQINELRKHNDTITVQPMVTIHKALQQIYPEFHFYYEKVPSVLRAIGLNPKNFLFNERSSVSEGQDWLRAYDGSTPKTLDETGPTNYGGYLKDVQSNYDSEANDFDNQLPPRILGRPVNSEHLPKTQQNNFNFNDNSNNNNSNNNNSESKDNYNDDFGGMGTHHNSSSIVPSPPQSNIGNNNNSNNNNVHGNSSQQTNMVSSTMSSLQNTSLSNLNHSNNNNGHHNNNNTPHNHGPRTMKAPNFNLKFSSISHKKSPMILTSLRINFDLRNRQSSDYTILMISDLNNNGYFPRPDVIHLAHLTDGILTQVYVGAIILFADGIFAVCRNGNRVWLQKVQFKPIYTPYPNPKGPYNNGGNNNNNNHNGKNPPNTGFRMNDTNYYT